MQKGVCVGKGNGRIPLSELVSWVDEEGCELGKELWVYPGEVSLCKLTVTRGLGIHADQGEK